MKRVSFFLAVLLLGSLGSRAQSTPEERQKVLDDLRKRVAEESANPRSSLYPPSSAQLAQAGEMQRRVPSYAEMEALYLNGKVTLRQYERYLKDHPIDPAARNQVVNPVATPGKAAPLATQPAIVTPAQPVVTIPPPSEQTPGQLNEVEAKMEELIRQKEAREKAQKNAAPAPEPKTKRDKLNLLLKLYVDEKITEQEYNERRAKILDEPGD